ncbi:hypothetical protein [Sorangium sp. So ce854]|uniref:Uncharacterized protein n=1 Tax=Sorangium cellulosum TaxID=56 RepID=A0A150P3X2_SORCE|nr:hypothetical protein BE08_12275 [Sorangium cellulosum]
MNHHLPVASDDETLAPARLDPHARLRRPHDDLLCAAAAEDQTTCPSVIGVTPHRGGREGSEGA